MAKTQNIPRGFRNNNPLNIRIGNVWLGERKNPTDPSFEQFVSMEYGIRAAFVLFRRYIVHYKRTTIPAIISAWAPSNENNTQKYIDVVVGVSGISPDTELDFFDEETMVKLFNAMCVVECGKPLPESIVIKGYKMS